MPDEMQTYGPRIAALDLHTSYPLGEDSFRLHHGQDYFAFFRRMGELRYLVAERDGCLLGVLAAVLRDLPAACGGPSWYLCDLKLADPGRGLMLARRLLQGLARIGAPGRYFGFSMDPAAGSSNRVARLVRRLFPLARAAGTLHLYSLSEPQMGAFESVLGSHVGPLSYLSLLGCKDLVLGSTGRTLPLFHVQHGPCATRAPGGLTEPQPGATHMFSCPAGSALDLAAGGGGLQPTAAATILLAQSDESATGLIPVDSAQESCDWGFVLTSDI